MQGEQSDLDSQFADIQVAMEAYLSAATKPIANALRCVVILSMYVMAVYFCGE